MNLTKYCILEPDYHMDSDTGVETADPAPTSTPRPPLVLQPTRKQIPGKDIQCFNLLLVICIYRAQGSLYLNQIDVNYIMMMLHKIT